MLPSLSEIRKRRMRLGISQRRLARDVGISQSMLAKVEAGRVQPSYEIARRIFEYLDGLERGVEGVAKDVHTEGIISVGKEETVGKAIELMHRYGFSQLPVREGRDRYIGSVIDRSLVDRLLSMEDPERLYSRRIEEVMEPQFPIVDEETPLHVVASLLRHSPAVLTARRGRVIGIITNADMLKAISKGHV